MALMQLFPRFEVSLDRLGSSEGIPRVRRPTLVDFRSGADLKKVVDVIGHSAVVSVDAAPGAGKTVRLPLALAQGTGKLVVHVLPYEMLALSTYRYLSRTGDGGSYSLITRVDEAWPASGVVLISAACLVARWLSVASVRMPECYLLQDESHESGAASAALRAFGPTAEGVISYVAMTATSGPVGVRKMETGGALDEQLYDPSAFLNPWSVEESGAPWAASELDGHVLIFEDDKERAQELVTAYNYNGVSAYRLHARTTPEEFINAMKEMEGRSRGICALIADSTYRSGYTFDVAVVVDSGYVRRVVATPEGPGRVSRPMYEFEMVQSRSRGARLPGSQTRYWRPVGDMKPVMCDLEQTDVEAMALICRILGYRPPSYAQGAKMASGQVPVDVPSALRSVIPLACMHKSQLVDPEELTRAPAAGPQVAVASVERQVTPTPKVSALEERVSSGPPAAGRAEEFDVADGMDVLSAMMAAGKIETQGVGPGDYCCADGVATTDLVCASFPAGVESVRRVMALDGSDTAHLAWSPYTRSVSVNALVHARNVELMELRALTTVLGRVRKSVSERDPTALRNWATQCAERVAYLIGDVEFLLDKLQTVAKGFCSIRGCPGLFEREENSYAESVYLDYMEVPCSDPGPASVAESRRVREWAAAASQAGWTRSSVSLLGGGGSTRQKLEVPGVIRYITGCPRLQGRGPGGSGVSTISGSTGSSSMASRHGKG